MSKNTLDAYTFVGELHALFQNNSMASLELKLASMEQSPELQTTQLDAVRNIQASLRYNKLDVTRAVIVQHLLVWLSQIQLAGLRFSGFPQAQFNDLNLPESPAAIEATFP